MPDSAERDSLLLEIRRYSALIGDLRDSLGTDRREIRLSPEHRARLENSIGELSKVIEQISTELGRMEFEVKDNTISLLDETGQGIVINIPENLDDQLSQGFHALSQIILAEPPDTVRAGAQRQLSWLNRSGRARPARRARWCRATWSRSGTTCSCPGARRCAARWWWCSAAPRCRGASTATWWWSSATCNWASRPR